MVRSSWFLGTEPLTRKTRYTNLWPIRTSSYVQGSQYGTEPPGSSPRCSDSRVYVGRGIILPVISTPHQGCRS